MHAKDGARQRLTTIAEKMVALSHRIHARPELAFEEEAASTWVAETLADGGFAVERGAFDLPTAVAARAGTGPVHVAFVAEYDALPGIGHACGHNIIAASSVGAALATAAVADDVGLTVHLIGAPAEETGGGKILLLERGAFDGMHAALMVHPAPVDVAEMPCLAFWEFDAEFHGTAAHASAFPERGVNAGDALTIAQVSVGLLRQHLRSTDRVHGIVTHGGDAPNVVPARASARYDVRARTIDELESVRTRVLRCFEAGALATGARLEVRPVGDAYAEMRHDAELATMYRRNAEKLGRGFIDLGPLAWRSAGSTDMGNVSQHVRAIHPTIGIASLPAVNHQPEFAAHCITAVADRAVVDGALALAWTALDAAEVGTLR
jgi:amidohydrolase